MIAIKQDRVYYIGVGDKGGKQIFVVVICNGQGTIKLQTGFRRWVLSD